MKRLTRFIIILSLILPLGVAAEDAPSKSRPVRSERSKSLSFDDALVEGMNSNQYDSLEHIAKKDPGGRQHLYRRKTNFHQEMHGTVRDMRYLQ